MIKKIRNKITEKEAIQFFNGNGPNTINNCKYFVGKKGSFDEVEEWFEINTLEGVMIAEDGDWIIKGLHGEFYPCKPDIFEKSYEIIS